MTTNHEPKHPITPKDMAALAPNGMKFFTVKVTVSEYPCPECGKQMTYRWTTGTYRGESKVAMIHAQCVENSESDHGYGPKSKHTDTSYKSGEGKKPEPKEEEVKPEDYPLRLRYTGDSDGHFVKGVEYAARNGTGKDSGFYNIKGVYGGWFKNKFEVIPESDGMLEQLQESVAMTKPKKETKTTGITQVLDTWLEDAIGERMVKLEDSIKELISKGAITKTIEIKTEAVDFKIEGLRHPVLDQLVERYARGERTFLLTGPAGTGKTTIARQFSQAVKAKRCTVIACSEDLRREAFVGFRTFNIKDGTAPYVASPVVEDLRCTEGVAVTILEEIDASNPNALLTINALENGFLPTPDCTDMPEHARPASHVLIATANTWGIAGSTQYVGRNQLDAATLDRYRTIFVDYDQGLERALVGDDSVLDLITSIREKVNEAQIRKVVSTRLAKRIAFDRKLEANKKRTVREVAKDVLVNSGWQKQELTRVGM